MNATGYCYYCNKKIGLLEECYPVRQELAVKQGALRFKAAGIACVKCVEVDDKQTTIFNKTEARRSDEQG